MRDKTHIESLEKWAEYVRTHKCWKKLHTEFINAQYEKAYSFFEKLKNQKQKKN